MIVFFVPPLRLEIADGDIAAESTDAVVNAANNHFWMGAGVAGALKARGGPSIEAEAMAQGPVEPGECVITSGGRLKACSVIHAAVMGQDLRPSAAIIERATRSALAMAEAHELGSIALPAFGTGVGGFPVDECAAIMIDAICAEAPPAAEARPAGAVRDGGISTNGGRGVRSIGPTARRTRRLCRVRLTMFFRVFV